MKTIITGIVCILILTAAFYEVRLPWGGLLSQLEIPRLFTKNEAPEKAARFEPSSPAIVKEMLKIAGVTKKDLVYDLGSGDGRILITAAREAGARGIGVDIDPELIAESRRNAKREHVDDLVQFLQEDLFETDIRNATVVMLYLTPKANLKLRLRLLRELKPGARIVSHSHDMGEWEPDKKSTAADHIVYSWTIPAPVSGIWRMEVPDKRGREIYYIEINQTFQKIKASIKTGQEDIPVTEARLKGKIVQFRVERAFGNLAAPADFTGEVAGDKVKGKFRSKTGSGIWTAERIKHELQH